MERKATANVIIWYRNIENIEKMTIIVGKILKVITGSDNNIRDFR